MDGRVVPEWNSSGNANWKSERGSVIITLQSAYLDTLSVGEHTLKAQFDDGKSATARFTIYHSNVLGANGAPKTGDESRIALWMLLFAGSIVLIGAGFRMRQKAG